MHIAAKQRHLKTVELLLEHGAGTEVKTKDGDAVLHCAAFGGEERIGEVLLKRGAVVEVKNSRGQGPLGAGRRGAEAGRLCTRRPSVTTHASASSYCSRKP